MQTQDKPELDIREHGQLNQPTERMNSDRAKALLRPIIKYWIVELMDCGGTDPNATCDFIAEEEPDLYNALGHDRVQALCEELHRAEDPALSEWYGTRFCQFNRQYFNGRLEGYRVRVVYDISFWVKEPDANALLGRTDPSARQVILAFTQTEAWHGMECALIHHMAHASTDTTLDDDERWLQEMARLKSAGAPIER